MVRRTSQLCGRSAELDALKRCLQQGSRIVTLLGPAGIGKTRLALEVISDFAAAGRPVITCDLDPVRDAQGVLDVIARSAQLRPSGPDGPQGLLRALSARSQTVLLLDNAEHVAQPLADLAASLMALPGDLALLVTSQVRLHLSEETCFELSPVPQNVARSIFLQTAARVQPNLTYPTPLVHAVLQGLDGLPLAIELAASRLRYRTLNELAAPGGLPVAQLFRGDRTLPARSRSLKSALQGAWQLLHAECRRAACALSAFEGGFQINDGLSVLSNAGIDDPESLLEILRDHSMVWARPWAGQTRLGLFDAVRRYIKEIVLQHEDMLHTASNHASHFALAAARARSMYWGEDPTAARLWLQSEQHNLRAALRHLSAHDKPGAVDLVHSLGPLLIFAGPVQDNRALLEQATFDAHVVSDPAREARARLNLASSYIVRGEFDQAWAHLERADALAPSHDVVGAEIRVAQAHVGLRQGRVDEAQDTLRAVTEELPAWQSIELNAQTRLQDVVFALELRPEQAAQCARDTRAWAQAQGCVRLAELSWLLEGLALTSQQAWTQAIDPLTRAVSAGHRLGEPIYLGWSQSELSRALLGLGQPQEAQRTATQGLREAEQAADGAAEAFLLVVRDEINLARDRLDLVRRDLPQTCTRVRAVGLTALNQRLEAIQAAAGLSPERGYAQIDGDARSFEVQGQRVSLVRRRAVRRILRCLAAAALGPPRALTWTELFAAGWPDTPVETVGARQRTYTAIWTLRNLGLEGHIETSGDGYRLVRVLVHEASLPTTAGFKSSSLQPAT